MCKAAIRCIKFNTAPWLHTAKLDESDGRFAGAILVR